jgi:hypothetical protein
MTEFSERVESLIKHDRQWRRRHRIAHAKAMLSMCDGIRQQDLAERSRNFWRAVLQRNED